MTEAFFYALQTMNLQGEVKGQCHIIYSLSFLKVLTTNIVIGFLGLDGNRGIFISS